jgi:hypothetical protein
MALLGATWLPSEPQGDRIWFSSPLPRRSAVVSDPQGLTPIAAVAEERAEAGPSWPDEVCSNAKALLYGRGQG